MNMLKRTLALMLVLCMMFTAVPFNAFATESTDEPSVPTTAPVDAPESDDPEEVVDDTADNAPDAVTPDSGIATASLDEGIATTSEDDGIATAAATMPSAPADGTTSGEPFPENTAGSYSFRIPALVTLSDGTLVAAADARWNTTYDGGGLDTMVAVSDNNGANWSYTFANYLGDNGNEYNAASSCFIDPSLAVYTTDENNDGVGEDTIYMLCDLYPTGVALNGNKQITPSYSTGFNSNGYLKLTTATLSSTDSDYADTDFTYYLKNGLIYGNDGKVVSGYSVDGKFNIFYNNTYVSNLFFADSPYKVARTGYLYLTKSTDDGKTWSDPTLLNLKTSSEMVCLVGPNGGMVTSNGTIVFPVYSYTGNAEYTGLIYSTDGGNSWKRSAALISIDSSEADVVELANGNLRVFFRNETAKLYYADYSFSSGWSAPVNTGIACNSNTELSAITYSKKIDGKQVILVSCPTGPNAAGSNDSNGAYRTSGKIFAGLVDPTTYQMTWLDKSVQVTPVASSRLSGSNYTAAQGFFAYSSIAELKDNSVAILYEDNQYGWGTGDNYGYTMNFKTYPEAELEAAFAVTFDEADVGGETTPAVVVTDATVELADTQAKAVTEVAGLTDFVAYDVTLTDVNGNNYTGSAVVTLPLNGKFDSTVVLKGFVVNTDGTIEYITDVTRDLDADTISFTVPHFSVVGVAEDDTAGKTVNVSIDVGETKTYIDKTGNHQDAASNKAPNAAIATMEVKGQIAVSDATVSTTKATKLEAGATYIIRVYNTNYALSSNAGLNTWGTETRAFEQNNLTANTNHFWTLEAYGDGYLLKSNTGKYLVMTSETNIGQLENTGEVMTFTNTSTGWTIGNQHGVYINNLGNANTSAGGWTDDGTRFDLYKVTPATEASTEITFKGVSVGNTTATVGSTTYNITVTAGTVKDTVSSNGQTGPTYVLDNDGTIEDGDTYVIVYDNKALAFDGSTVASIAVTENSNGTLTIPSNTDMANALWVRTENLLKHNPQSKYLSINYGSVSLSNNNTDYYSNVSFTADGDGYKVYKDRSTTDYYLRYNNSWTGSTNSTTVKLYKYSASSEAWTVDAAKQNNRYNSFIGLDKDLYSDDSWTAYETARQTAYNLLNEVTSTSYASEALANAALTELVAAVDTLEQAKNALVTAQTISVRYRFNGTVIDIREYKTASDATSLTLPGTIIVNNVIYQIPDTTQELNGNTTIFVDVTELGALGGGFVGGANISNGSETTTVSSNPVKEMTVTTGITYDLNLATSLTSGQSVEWTTGDSSVAKVDQNGLVTATGAGTTTIVATVTDSNGNVVEVNSIPITVLEPNYKTDDPTRTVAVYIDNIDNTTVWCMINGAMDANGDFDANRVFEVVEGELIYGEFKMSTGSSTDTNTTTALTFFGDPDEAHALVSMTSTNSFGNYYQIHDKDGNLYDGTKSGMANGDYFISGQTTGAGYWHAVGLGGNSTTNPNWAHVKEMVQWAIDNGCDGALGFTKRQTEGEVFSNLTFVSDPMPRIEKTVDGVLPTTRLQADYRTYSENMVASVHELVYFKIKVTLERPTVWAKDAAGNITTTGAISYSDAWLKDTVLDGAYLYTKDLDQADGKYDGEIAEANRTQMQEITDQLNKSWAADETVREREFYLVYEIQESDIPKFQIKNVATLEYNYESHYSNGAQTGAANADAHIIVFGAALDDVVIDFGQPVTYTGLTNGHLKGVYVDGVNTASHATAKYGTVKVYREATGEYDEKNYPEYNYTVTYTPTTILPEVDTVELYGIGEDNTEKVINSFRVFPATTVYYEEGFMLNADSTLINGKPQMASATHEQAFELLGKSQFNDKGLLTNKISDQKHVYGYDPLYTDNPFNYGQSYVNSTAIGQATTFTFTGTGFDLYANCTDATGTVAVMVTNSAGACVKYYTVNTVTGFSALAGQDQDNNEYHLPIVSEQGLAHGTYTVTITKIMKNGEVKLDGVRIFNTLENSNVYGIDLEDNPVFYQLRDTVLKAIDIKDSTSEDYGNLTDMADQVYGELIRNDADTSAELPSANAVLTSPEGIYGAGVTAQTLLDNGPKNELFLYNGQTLTFKVKTAREMQIGLKAPVAGTSYSMAVTGLDTKTGSVNTSVDMFYPIGNPIGTEQEYTISITNTGDKILSVTDLKICDDPSFAFAPLTVEDIKGILVDAGYTDDEVVEPEVPETPVEPEVPEETTKPTEPEVEETTKPSKPGNGNKPGNNKPETTKPTKPTKPTEPVVPETTTKPTEPDVPEVTVKPTEPQKPGKPGNNGNQKPGKDEEKTYTLKITFVNLFGKKVGTATITTTNGVVSAYEIAGKAPAGYHAIWLIPVTLRTNGNTSVVIPVI